MKNNVDNDGVVFNLFGGPIVLKPRGPRETATPCGSPLIYRASLCFEDNGRKVAKKGDALDLDAMIQAALPSTDIVAIVARAKMGDESVLHVNPGFVGDAVKLPKDLYDYKAMNDLYDSVKGSFNTLPDGVKALFNNDPNIYLNQIISNKAEKIIQDYKKSLDKVNEPKENNENA